MCVFFLFCFFVSFNLDYLIECYCTISFSYFVYFLFRLLPLRLLLISSTCSYYFHKVSKNEFLGILAHLSPRLISELIVYVGSRRPSSSNDFSSEAVRSILQV